MFVFNASYRKNNSMMRIGKLMPGYLHPFFDKDLGYAVCALVADTKPDSVQDQSGFRSNTITKTRFLKRTGRYGFCYDGVVISC